ncbi:MAG: hypothetical protein KDA96_02415, partial [Planctomycetaceae bacterium]|nr:hypothetical protein [Planctomycetaceae bacterium]
TGSGIIGTPILFDGGTGFDSLEIRDGDSGEVQTTIYTPGTSADSGRLQFLDDSDQQVMLADFTGLEPVVNRTGRRHDIRGRDDSENYRVEFERDVLDVHPFAEVRINQAEKYRFELDGTAEEFLTIYAGDGTDSVEVVAPVAGSFFATYPWLSLTVMEAEDVSLSGDAAFEGYVANESIAVQSRYESFIDTVTARIASPFFQNTPLTLSAYSASSVTIKGGPGNNSLQFSSPDPIDESITLASDPSEGTSALRLVHQRSLTPGHSVGTRIIAETFGVVTLDTGGGTDQLVILGSDIDDAVTVTATSVTFDGMLVPLQHVEQIRVEGNDGNDTLWIDESGGLVALPGGVHFNGHNGRDSLVVHGAQTADSHYVVGPEIGDGFIQRTGASGTSRISFTGLEPVIDMTPGTVTVTGTNADNAINLATGPNSEVSNAENPGGAATGIVSIDGFETYEFAGKSTVTIDGQAGRDVFGISNLLNGFVSGGNTVVQGSDPADGDEIILTGTLSDDSFEYQAHPRLNSAGTFSVNSGLLDFFGIEIITVNGRSGDDELTAFGDALTPEEQETGATGRDDEIELTPRGHRESTLRFNNSTPLELLDFESVYVDPRSGIDQLRVFGTPFSDMLTFDAATLTLNGQTFGHANTEIFSAFANSGDDAIGVSGGLVGAVTADGGDGRDLLSVVSPPGSPVGLALPGTIKDARTMTTIAIEAFALNAGSENVVIAGAPDAVSGVSLTPTSSTGVHLDAAGRGYDVFTNGVITVSGASPNLGSGLPLRRLDVYGTVFDDTISVSETLVDVGGGLKQVSLSGLPFVTLYADEGADSVFLTPSSITGFVVDGGGPAGFGDALTVDGDATFFAGPLSDSGAYIKSGLRPVSFAHIETHSASAALQSGPSLVNVPASTTSPRPQLDWTPVDDAVWYDVEFLDLTRPNRRFVERSMQASLNPSDDLLLGRYRLQVRAVLSSGLITNWGTSTQLSVQPKPTIQVPPTSSDGQPQIQWTPIAGANSYELWIDNRSTGQSKVLYRPEVRGTTFTPVSPLPIGQLAVWVRPTAESGFTGSWARAFVDVTTAPVLISPVGKYVGGSPVFEWSAVEGAQRYDLFVRRIAPVYSSVYLRRSDITSTGYVHAESFPEGTYQFWVKAWTDGLFGGSWSSALQFSTFAAPFVLGPASSSAQVTSAISWTAVKEAAEYELEIRRPDGTLVRNESHLTSTSYQSSPAFEYGTEYLVRVRGRSSTGTTGAWSADHRFTTPPAQVVAIGPSGGGLTPGMITFQWQIASGAAVYEVWVDRLLPAWEKQVEHQTSVSETSLTREFLTPGTYRWWVRAISADGKTGLWSSAQTFEIVADNDAVPDLFVERVDENVSRSSEAELRRNMATESDQIVVAERRQGTSSEYFAASVSSARQEPGVQISGSESQWPELFGNRVKQDYRMVAWPLVPDQTGLGQNTHIPDAAHGRHTVQPNR